MFVGETIDILFSTVFEKYKEQMANRREGRGKEGGGGWIIINLS